MPPRTGYAYLDDVLDRPGWVGPVVAMAHRGGAGHPDLLGRENTLAAFRHAADLGYRYLETDVHTTRDGALVAFHDDVLDRVTDHRGAVADLAWSDVARIRVGVVDGAAGEPLPLLTDLLEELPDARFNVDLKSDAAVAPLADLVERTGAADRLLVGSFSGARMAQFRRLTSGRVATSASPAEVAIVKTMPTRVVRRLVAGPSALQVPRRRGPLTVVDAALLRRAHAAGLHVHVWTVDEPSQMAELLDLGVDGLITDRTDRLRDVLLERGQWAGVA